MSENDVFTVYVAFRKNADYSNSNKNTLIGWLPGPYKVSHNDLNDMDKRGTHAFPFPKKELADDFAKGIMHSYNHIFDVQTSHPID